MNPRVPLAERLRTARAIHALALKRAKTEPAAPAPVIVAAPRTEPEDRSAAIRAARAIEASPLHVCGVRMVLCADCAQWVCRAPGHLRHVCAAPEFSQVEP